MIEVISNERPGCARVGAWTKREKKEWGIQGSGFDFTRATSNQILHLLGHHLGSLPRINPFGFRRTEIQSGGFVGLF